MRTFLIYDLETFFKKIGYNWEKDIYKLKTICHFTKTRVKPKMEAHEFDRGSEQPFVIKAVAEWINAKSFFEIGTGRGTACYSVSLLPTIENITTIDIVPHDFKKNEAIGYRSAVVSNKDLFEKIPYEEKNKIDFRLRKEKIDIMMKYKNHFDLCFIDGNHTDPNIIYEDYMICRQVMKDDGIIIWDDYELNRFAIKSVVDQIIKEEPEIDIALIELRGHIFKGKEGKEKEKDSGMVMMKKGKLF